MEVDDLVTLVLVKWSFSEILYFFSFLIEIINQKGSIDLEESRFLDETLIRSSGERDAEIFKKRRLSPEITRMMSIEYTIHIVVK